MGFSVDFDAWPLVQAVHHGKRRSVDDANDMVAALQQALDRNERFAVAFDSTEMVAPEPGSNDVLTAYFMQHHEALSQRCAGIGYYITNPKVLAAMQKMEEDETPEQRAAMPVATSVSDDWEQTRRWALDQLGQQTPTT